MGLTHQEYLDKEGTCYVVKGIKIDYRIPARMDELLTVRTTAVKLTRFALDLLQEVLRDGEVLVSMEIRLGYISLATGRPRRFPRLGGSP